MEVPPEAAGAEVLPAAAPPGLLQEAAAAPVHLEIGLWMKWAGGISTGWFTDVDGHVYYLHPIGDGTRGRMYTGWNQIEGKWYYFNPVSDGTRGALFVNGQTPDGYTVDANGIWIP